MLSWTLLQIQPLFEMVGLQEKNYSYIFGNTVIHHYTRSKSYKLMRAWIWTAYLFYKTRNGLGKRVKKKKKKTWMIGYSWYAWSVRVKDGLTAVVLACIGSSSLAALLLFKKLTDILRCHHLNKKGEKRINIRLYKLIFISTIYISSCIAYLSFCCKSLQIVLQFCLHVIIFWGKMKCELHCWIDSKWWVVTFHIMN